MLKKLCIVILVTALLAVSIAGHSPKRIALSIDDAPSPDTPLFTGKQRTLATIAQLKKAKSPPVGVFAIGRHVVDFGADQLNAFARAGHAIGNHTFTHLPLKSCNTHQYIQDIARTDLLLKQLPGYVQLFRYPCLDEGNPQQSHQVQAALTQMGYTNAYVTINNFDFYMNTLVQQAVRRGQFVDFQKLKDVYVRVMLECVEFYDGLATLQKRHPLNHVLLLHANDLTALYVGDLLTALRERGWTIISIHNAYKAVPKNFKNKFAKVQMELTANPASLRNAPKGMSLSYLSELFKQENVFIDVKPLQTYTAAK
jgi:peptidoglycan/xylan/chitin deacetylase (PgdA/CDA1 family)